VKVSSYDLFSKMISHTCWIEPDASCDGLHVDVEVVEACAADWPVISTAAGARVATLANASAPSALRRDRALL